MSTIDSFFGGAPGLTWPKAENGEYRDTRLMGVARGGRIVADPEVTQMTDMATGSPLWWDNEKTRPKMQLVVTLLCDGSTGGVDERDRSQPMDTGERRLYVKGKELPAAIKAAFTSVGAPGLRVGGTLLVAWTGSRPSKIRGGDPARTWAAKYEPPAVGIPAQTAQEAAAGPFGGTPPQTGNPTYVPPQYGQQPGPAPQPSANPFGGQPAVPGSYGPNPGVPAQPPASPFGQPAQPGQPPANPFGG